MHQLGRFVLRGALVFVLTIGFLMTSLAISAVGVHPAGAASTVATWDGNPDTNCNEWFEASPPPGQTTATVVLSGAGGGGGLIREGTRPTGGSGGAVTETLVGVTQPVWVEIGCGGGLGLNPPNTAGTGGQGFGDGGSGGSLDSGSDFGGGGGGSASVLCIGSSSCATPLAVASGGGGTGGENDCDVHSNAGNGGSGNSGGGTSYFSATIAVNGGSAGQQGGDGLGGGGASDTAGGGGGAGYNSDGIGSYGGGSPWGSVGGNGGQAGEGSWDGDQGGSGGGGGGGYNAGGGGGSDTCSGDLGTGGSAAGGGGGGGASAVNLQYATSYSWQSGAEGGPSETWDTAAPTITCPNGVGAVSTGCPGSISLTWSDAVPPQVTGVNPTAGPVGGGNQVTITGTNLTPATEVNFGWLSDTDATIVSQSPNQLVVTAPPADPSEYGGGPIPITVTTSAGSSTQSQAYQYSPQLLATWSGNGDPNTNCGSWYDTSVPPNATTGTVSLTGAGGGSSYADFGGANGGDGSLVSTVLNADNLTGGVLGLDVGCGGGSVSTGAEAGGLGFATGGSGAVGVEGPGGGGGATGLCLGSGSCSSASSTFLVAGGGGGAGGTFVGCGGLTAPGGSAGAGINNSSSSAAEQGGGDGSSGNGGGGGGGENTQGGSGGSEGSEPANGMAGDDPSPGNGGNGGTDFPDFPEAGGGGGGGWSGGGGGGASSCAGGGGGGSSIAAEPATAGVANTTFATGAAGGQPDNEAGSNGSVSPLLWNLAAPTITSVYPSSGPVTGGTQVTITGTNLDPASSVGFGSQHRGFAILSQSSTQIVVQAIDAISAGPVDVYVTTDAGVAVADDAYTYIGPPEIATTSLPAATLDTPYSTTLIATGGVPPYTWSVWSGTLPVGLTLSPTGVIAGTPTSIGTANLAFKVTDANGAGAIMSHAVPLSVGKFATTTGATTDPTSTTYGSSVSYSATVAGGENPTGTVSFAVGAVSLCTAALSNGTATCSADNAPAGTNQSVVATYSGDGSNAGSQGSATLNVGPDTTTTIASTNSSDYTYGTSASYSATVTGSSAGPGILVPTGLVTFTTGTTTLCTSTLSGGTASCNSTGAPVGPNVTITATYGGDAAFTSSSGTTAIAVTAALPGVSVTSV
jgi:hypothetical protein